MEEDQPNLQPWEQTLNLDDDHPFLRPHRRPNKPPLIPGPAAALQAAMRRRRRHLDQDPTQDYIRTVLANGGVDDDDEDFAAHPWLFALDFLRTHGFVGAEQGMALSSIRNGIHGDRVDLVVAIVKSCTRTALGDLMVTLKDLSGTVGASIHRKVLSEGEDKKNIAVGSVLILQKVAVFAPSRSTHYLNVTLSNVVKVISKDSETPLKQNYQTSSIRFSGPSCETREMSQMPQANATQERIQGIMSNLRKNSSLIASVYSQRVMGPNATQETSRFNNENYKNRTHAVTTEDCVISADERSKLFKMNNGDYSYCNTYMAEATNDEETETALGTKMQKQLPVSSSSAPDWTEEQLDQLGMFDD